MCWGVGGTYKFKNKHEMYIVYLISSTTPDTKYLQFSSLRKELAIPIDVMEVSKPEKSDLAGEPL